MCPVQQDPGNRRRRKQEELRRRRRRRRIVIGIVLVVASMVPAFFLLDVPVISQFREDIRTSRTWITIRETTSPAVKAIGGDLRPVQRWIDHRRQTPLLALCAGGVCLGLLVMMRR